MILIKKLKIANLYNNIAKNIFFFSSQQASKINEEDQMAQYYRNTIKQIKINQKGKGKFTQHQLIKLTKLTNQSEQIPLLLQAYYNFLGHFTFISNRTVDKMLLKIFSLPSPPLQQIIQIYNTHFYLQYFPHYSVTSQAITILKDNNQLFQKLVKTFRKSPLIKFNNEITNQLFNILQQDHSSSSSSQIGKLLKQRLELNLIQDHINKDQLLNQLNKIEKQQHQQ